MFKYNSWIILFHMSSISLLVHALSHQLDDLTQILYQNTIIVANIEMKIDCSFVIRNVEDCLDGPIYVLCRSVNLRACRLY